MKKATVTGILFLLVLSANAQSFQFYLGEQPLEDNAEITVSDYTEFFSDDDYTVLSLESELKLKNISKNDVQATVTQTILEGPMDSENGYLSFCFLDCTTGNANRVKNGLIPAGSFSVGYHVNFYVYEGIYNRIKVKYEVYLANDSDGTDRKTVTVTYSYDESSTSSIRKPEQKPLLTVFSDANGVIFNYDPETNATQLEIYSLTGQKMALYPLMAGNGTFVLREKIGKGIYVCVLKNEKLRITAQKFHIR